MKNNLSSYIEQLTFDADKVPTFYQWSGYCQSVSDFREHNFMKNSVAGNEVYICSEENGVGLGDYLATYILRQPFIQDMEMVFSPGCNYWFFKAWEQSAPFYEDLDDWCQQIVELFISRGLLARVNQTDTDYFVFCDLIAYEDTKLPDDFIDDIRQVCEAALLQYFAQVMENYGDSDELSIGDAGEWAEALLHRFMEEGNLI